MIFSVFISAAISEKITYLLICTWEGLLSQLSLASAQYLFYLWPSVSNYCGLKLMFVILHCPIIGSVMFNISVMLSSTHYCCYLWCLCNVSELALNFNFGHFDWILSHQKPDNTVYLTHTIAWAWCYIARAKTDLQKRDKNENRFRKP